VVAVDIAEEMVQVTAAALAATDVRRSETLLMNAEQLDFPDGLFDLVLCGFGVFFFLNPAAAIAEVRRVLNGQTGRFVASTFLDGAGGYPWTDDIARELGREVTRFPGPIRTAPELVELLSATGFETSVRSVQARFVFADVDGYVRWLWSHGGRRLLEQLTPDEQARHRDASARRLADHVTRDGYELIQTVEMTIARPIACGTKR
jgi:SAM-dependent methyltransferase